jgi:hypothetical protein
MGGEGTKPFAIKQMQYIYFLAILPEPIFGSNRKNI